MRHLIIACLALFAGFAHAECFIDGAFTPRCIFNHGQTPGAYHGVSWPVFTADTPEEVWAETEKRADGILAYAQVTSSLNVKHVRLDTPEHYPDVVCFDFYHGGVKHSQTCFDTMEITER